MSTTCTYNATTLATYDEFVEAYRSGTPTVVAGAMKDFIDESFATLPLNAQVLELGSGLGRDAIYLSAKGFTVTATDAAPAFLKVLSEQGLTVEKLDVLKDPIPNSDAVFANAVFLHFNGEDFSVILDKIFAALSPGGRLIFTVKEGAGQEWSEEKLHAPRFFNYWNEEELRATLARAGFSSCKVTVDASGPTSWLEVVAFKGC